MEITIRQEGAVSPGDGPAEGAPGRSAGPGPEPASGPLASPAGPTSLCEELWPAPAGASKRRQAPSWKDFACGYRLILFDTGAEIAPDAQRGDGGRRGFDAKRIEAERRRDGRLPLVKALRCQMRHFTDAAVLGSEAFVDSVFAAFPERFGPRRESGARKLRGVEAGGLRCLRDLQTGV